MSLNDEARCLLEFYAKDLLLISNKMPKEQGAKFLDPNLHIAVWIEEGKKLGDYEFVKNIEENIDEVKKVLAGYWGLM